jgi:hypothetical protein
VSRTLRSFYALYLVLCRGNYRTQRKEDKRRQRVYWW